MSDLVYIPQKIEHTKKKTAASDKHAVYVTIIYLLQLSLHLPNACLSSLIFAVSRAMLAIRDLSYCNKLTFELNDEL